MRGKVGLTVLALGCLMMMAGSPSVAADPEEPERSPIGELLSTLAPYIEDGYNVTVTLIDWIEDEIGHDIVGRVCWWPPASIPPDAVISYVGGILYFASNDDQLHLPTWYYKSDAVKPGIPIPGVSFPDETGPYTMVIDWTTSGCHDK